jgi:hypothetical protein
MQLRKWFGRTRFGLFCVVNVVFKTLPSPYL